MTPIILSLSFLSLGSLFVAGDPIHVPVHRLKSSQNVDLTEIAHRVKVKYGLVEPSVSRINRRASSPTAADVPLTNQDGDVSYFASITVGTPPQTLNVVLDTESSDLWLAGTSCQTCTGIIPVFDPSKSSTFQSGNTASNPSSGSTALGSPIEIQYGSGNVSGTIAADTISMGGVSVTNQKLVNVNSIQGSILNADPKGASGIMGLAFTGLARTGATPFWLALVNGNQLEEPGFSFWISRSTNPQGDAPGGIFTLGGHNSDFFTGEIEYLSLNADLPVYWTLPLTSVQVNGISVDIQTSTSTAAFDLGTTLIAGPLNDVTAIWDAVPGSGPSPSGGSGFFNFPCNTPVLVSVSFGGKIWTISAIDLIFALEPTDHSKCIGSIFALTIGPPGSGVPTWIFGDAFLKNVYSVFRSTPPSIGFAQLSTVADPAGIAPTPLTSFAPPMTGLPGTTASVFNGVGGTATSSAPTGTGSGGVQNGADSLKPSLLVMLCGATIAILNLQ